MTTTHDDFFRIAEQLVLLTKDEALSIAEAVKTSGQAPGQVAVQKGLLDAAEIDIIETLLHPFDAVPGYEIVDVLGQGGMGVVYRARQLNLNRIVALKTIRLSRMSDKSAAGRFEKEARTVGRLRHPNIVAAYDFGRHEGRLYLAMELVEGEDVESLLRDEGRLDEPTAWGLARQTAAGLAHADHLGVVHRDIKPANLLLVEPPEGFLLPEGLPMVKIADFGLAFLSDDHQAHTRLTSDNSAVGSPHYMAPEQLTEIDVDFRADIYALGASVYHMLSGKPPFGGLNLSQIIAQKLSGEIQKLSHRCPDISPESCHLVARMLARDPQDRPATYRELMEEIDKVTASARPHSAVLKEHVERSQEGMKTDVVSALDTQVVKQADKAGAATPSRIIRRFYEQPRWMVAGAVAALLAVSVGLLLMTTVWGGGGPPQRVPMQPSGSLYSLFNGRTLVNWRNEHGMWIVDTDAEGAGVIAGTNGELTHPLFKRGPDDQPIPYQFYSLEFVVNPHEAAAVEARFGYDAQSPPEGAYYFLRIDQTGYNLSERASDNSGRTRTVIAGPLKQEFARRHRIRIESQPTGWFVSLDDQELTGLPRRASGEAPLICLAAEGGPAWFSDVLIEEQQPVDPPVD